MEDLTSISQHTRDGDAVAGEHDEDAMLAQFADGDADAARKLISLLGPRCFSVAFRMLGNHAEAEDVAQDAMMRLWKIAPDWQPGDAKISTWLYKVTFNLCIDQRRKKKPETLEALQEPPDESASASDRMQDVARIDALQAALAELPERQRQAVILRHIEELPNPEIAGIMAISVEAVESLTARGKRTLARNLAGRRDELGYENG